MYIDVHTAAAQLSTAHFHTIKCALTTTITISAATVCCCCAQAGDSVGTTLCTNDALQVHTALTLTHKRTYSHMYRQWQHVCATVHHQHRNVCNAGENMLLISVCFTSVCFFLFKCCCLCGPFVCRKGECVSGKCVLYCIRKTVTIR